MTHMIGMVPLEFWIFVLILLATAATHFFIRNYYFTLFVFIISSLILLLMVSLEVMSHYLETHIIGTLTADGLGEPYSRSGWSLLLDAWPLWVVPTVITAAITGLLCAWFLPKDSHSYLEVIQQAGSSATDHSGPTATTSKVILKQLEINELQQKLAIAEEKYRQAAGQSAHKPARMDKFMNEISDLRKKTQELEKLVAKYRSENQQLTADLSSAQRLVDDLMSR